MSGVRSRSIQQRRKTEMIDEKKLMAWLQERKAYWRENRTEDPRNCWARLNEDTSLAAYIESLAEEVER